MHISKVHGTANLVLYDDLYEIRTLKILEAHSTHVSLRYVSKTSFVHWRNLTGELENESPHCADCDEII